MDTIVLGPVCKLRKIFTMRNRLSELGNICNSFDVNNEDYLPQEHMFALGVDNVVQVLDMMALQKTITSLSNSSNGWYILYKFNIFVLFKRIIDLII